MGKVRDEELADMAYVMADVQGRRLVYRLLESYGLYRSVALHHPAGIRPEERLPYNAAHQEVAQALRNEALACDKQGTLYLTMMSEAQRRHVERELEARKKDAEAIRLKKENGDDDGSDGASSGADGSGDPGSGT